MSEKGKGEEALVHHPLPLRRRGGEGKEDVHAISSAALLKAGREGRKKTLAYLF